MKKQKYEYPLLWPTLFMAFIATLIIIFAILAFYLSKLLK